MPIQFRCSHCHKRVQAPDSAGGKKAKCPTCRQLNEVPIPKADDDDPLAGLDEFLLAHGSERPPLSPPLVPPISTLNTKPTYPCPYCGEEILRVAAKCKHCGEFVGPKGQRDERVIETNVRQSALIGAVTCLVIGVGFLYVSLFMFILYSPLFIAAFILSIVAMAQGRVVGGVVTLLLTVIVPPVLIVVLGVVRAGQAVEDLKNRSGPRATTPTATEESSGGTSHYGSATSPDDGHDSVGRTPSARVSSPPAPHTPAHRNLAAEQNDPDGFELAPLQTTEGANSYLHRQKGAQSALNAITNGRHDVGLAKEYGTKEQPPEGATGHGIQPGTPLTLPSDEPSDEMIEGIADNLAVPDQMPEEFIKKQVTRWVDWWPDPVTHLPFIADFVAYNNGKVKLKRPNGEIESLSYRRLSPDKLALAKTYSRKGRIIKPPFDLTWNDDVGTALQRVQAILGVETVEVHSGFLLQRVADAKEMTLEELRAHFQQADLSRELDATIDKNISFVQIGPITIVAKPVSFNRRLFELRTTFQCHTALILLSPRKAMSQATQLLGNDANCYLPIFLDTVELSLDPEYPADQASEIMAGIADRISKERDYASLRMRETGRDSFGPVWFANPADWLNTNDSANSLRIQTAVENNLVYNSGLSRYYDEYDMQHRTQIQNDQGVAQQQNLEEREQRLKRLIDH